MTKRTYDSAATWSLLTADEQSELVRVVGLARCAGLSRRQIREQFGISESLLRQVLVRATVPAPTWTVRAAAKDHLRARARELRLRGGTVPGIATELGVARSSVSMWVRDLPLVRHRENTRLDSSGVVTGADLATDLIRAGTPLDVVAAESGLSLPEVCALEAALTRRHPGGRSGYPPETRAVALDLASRGISHREIGRRVGVHETTVTSWVDRDGGPDVGADGRRRARERAREQVRSQAEAEIPSMDRAMLLALGSVAYWCEGAKAKPRRPSQQVVFINSDPALIQLFLAFLNAAGVDPARLVASLHIHETANIDEAIEYWIAVTAIPRAQFRKTVVKRHRPLTNRHNRGDGYRGCLVVRVAQSTTLYRQVEGWVRGVMAACGVDHAALRQLLALQATDDVVES